MLRDICQDCWYEVNPDQYFPNVTRYGTCARCGYDCTLVTRTKVECPESPTGDHESSDTLCATCLQYDWDEDEVCPEADDDDQPHTVSDALCVWCMEYEA